MIFPKDIETGEDGPNDGFDSHNLQLEQTTRFNPCCNYDDDDDDCDDNESTNGKTRLTNDCIFTSVYTTKCHSKIG